MVPEFSHKTDDPLFSKTPLLGRIEQMQRTQVVFHHERDGFGYAYAIADPEKAIADYLYLNTSHLTCVDKTYFEDALRLQNVGILNCEKLLLIAECFSQKKLNDSIRNLITFIEENS